MGAEIVGTEQSSIDLSPSQTDDGAQEPDAATVLWTLGDHQGALALALRDNRTTMYAIARRIAGDEYAADITQDVLVRMWANKERFDPSRGTLGNYLRVAVRGASIDLVRSAVARRSREERSRAIEPMSMFDGLAEVLDRERAGRVVQALKSISENERDAVISAFYGHLTYREIASRSGIPEGTIKSRIRLGLIHLRSELRDLV